MKSQKTVIVGMSGGVDSSLTAALLKEEGYAVIGVYMKNWSDPIAGVEHCPWVEDALDARRVAHQLQIPFYTVNFEKEYKQHVMAAFFADYAAGLTPNPDVLCNKFIKFDALWQYALRIGADFIATGHYAQVEGGRLYKGLDPKKDQSYFLWAINPEVLPHVLFPLGGMTKAQVRQEAAKRGLVTASKRDSQGICFIGQADVRQFLREHFYSSASFQPGQVKNKAGAVIGTHEGAGYYTIGQRLGVGNITWEDNRKRPTLYVRSTNTQSNTIVAGVEADLYSNRLSANQVSWLGLAPSLGEPISAKIRYGQPSVGCVIVNKSDQHVTVRFDAPQRAITPGQSIVFYHGEQLVGGGIINQEANDSKPQEVTRKPSRVATKGAPLLKT